MLLTLQTLTSKPLQEQIDIIELLSTQCPDLYEVVYSLITNRSAISIFTLSLSGDRVKVIRVALLSLVAGDITTIPDQAIRGPYQNHLDELCRHFAIEPRDLDVMIRFAEHVRGFLESKNRN